MEINKTALNGALIFELGVCGDKRGYFFESFSPHEFNENSKII